MEGVFGVARDRRDRRQALLGLALYEATRVDKGEPRLGDRWANTKVIDLRSSTAR